MKAQMFLLAFLLSVSLAHSAEQKATPVQKAKIALQKLKAECDNPKISNESEWMCYASKTELLRGESIRELKSLGEVGAKATRDELGSAKDEYRQMLTITLTALGDKDSLPETVNLMLHAEKPAVRFVAASELGRLKNNEFIEPFKQALADPFKRRDGSCARPGIIYPVRLVASDALVELGLTLEEVRKIGKWWDVP